MPRSPSRRTPYRPVGSTCSSTDASHATDPDVTWRTLKADRSADDIRATETLTLPRAAPGSFVSRGVLLVVDNVDHQQDTHSGLRAGAGEVRAFGASNHRLRRA